MIAQEAHRRGHDVHLLTSRPELTTAAEGPLTIVTPFSTFDDLHALMAFQVQHGNFDAIVHCAAVSDFNLPACLLAQKQGPVLVPRFRPIWPASSPSGPAFPNRSKRQSSR